MNIKAYVKTHLQKQKLLIKRVLHNEREFMKKIGVKLHEKVYEAEEHFFQEEETPLVDKNVPSIVREDAPKADRRSADQDKADR
jgi:hypothetical protein